MLKLTGQEKMQTPPIGTHESWASPSIRPYTDVLVIVAFETRDKKILVFKQDNQLVLPAELSLRNVKLFDFPDLVIKNQLNLKPTQIRDEYHKFPLRLLGGVPAGQNLFLFLKVPIRQVHKPGWHYINDKDLPDLESQVEPAFFVLADKLWNYSPATVQ